MSNPPPVIMLYRQSIETMFEKSINQKIIGEKWNDEPPEVRKVFYFEIYEI
jgi:hypothetical protein